jgi:hypothetical protein
MHRVIQRTRCRAPDPYNNTLNRRRLLRVIMIQKNSLLLRMKVSKTLVILSADCNSESRRAHAKFSDEHVPNVDVKSEATTTRDDYAISPNDAGPPADTSTAEEPLDGSSAYARPPTVPQIGSEAFSSPPGYMGPSERSNVYPRYSSPSSFSSPPPSTPPSRNLLSLAGGNVNPPSQNQSSDVPPSFSRPLPPNLYYITFPPTYLIANGRHLDDGFPVVPPPSPVQPHPFSSRDVREVDWIR